MLAHCATNSRCERRAIARVLGESAFEHVHGQGFWDYLATHPEESRIFDRSQQAMTRLELLWVLRAYDWAGIGTIVDVGGGNGAFLPGLLQHHAAMRGVLFDRLQEWPARLRSWDFAAEYLGECDVTPVERPSVILILGESCAVEVRSGKQTACPRIGQYLVFHHGV